MTIKSANNSIFPQKNPEPMKNYVNAICFLSTYITSKLLM